MKSYTSFSTYQVPSYFQGVLIHVPDKKIIVLYFDFYHDFFCLSGFFSGDCGESRQGC